MRDVQILDYLGRHKAVLTNSHFIYTSGMHGTSYINMREVAHDVEWMGEVGQSLSHRLHPYDVDLVLGPETLGRTLATLTASWNPGAVAIWCDIDEEAGEKRASFSPKLNFDRLVVGKRVAIVDDLLTTGSSIKATANLVTEVGGEVIVGAAVVRRTPDVTAEMCGVPALEVLADVEGFKVFTEDECASEGPCSVRKPVVLRPGHGWKWVETHPDYPII